MTNSNDEEFSYKNNLVWYDTIYDEKRSVIVHRGDYKDIEDVKGEFGRYLESREGIKGEPKNAEDLYIYIYVCSKGWILQ